MTARLLVAAACLLAGCGDGESGGGNAPDTARIEQLSTPKNIVAPQENTTELLPLSREDISRAGFGTAPCAFVADGRLLVAASGEGALARFRGGLRRLAGSLYIQVLIGIVLGGLLGYVKPTWGVELRPLGDAFVSLVKMLIGPIIFTTVVVGLAGMGDLKKVGRVGLVAGKPVRGSVSHFGVFLYKFVHFLCKRHE